ncbi:hypothetical protein FisN_6Lh230 [Fistulifera solaris]|uniref:Uncharacterized protein n=1 Tax=Fistulifera solaris TaxID=1519565 RepID=A0A1Z5J5X9_FISSO|nr:hypothetical protein FisN_6Lh230 [Fistulifera solaris]|eukprot:GAX09397.1 hypothetical protein FisN_6Lh230 [Fistulifera solaris]
MTEPSIPRNNKPPPKIDGMVHLANDRPSFTDKERQRMLQSVEGRWLARAMKRCEGHERAIREARAEWLKQRDNSQKRTQLEEERHKYIECLTFVTCPAGWRQYSQCWTHSLAHYSNTSLQQQPEAVCQYERQSLELCVGNVVVGAVRAAVPAEIDDEEMFL